MKKILFLLSLIVVLNSCLGGVLEPRTTITADLSLPSTKVEINGLNFEWTADDKIAVFPVSSNSASADVFTLIDGAGTSSGTFQGISYLTKGIAKYPYLPGDVLSEDVLYTYFESNFDLKAGIDGQSLMMFSDYDRDGNIHFRNLSSVLRLPITGECPIDMIAIVPISEDVRMAGNAQIQINGGDPIFKLSEKQDIYNIFDIRYEGNLELDKSRIQNVYLSLPPQKYPGGLKFIVSSTWGTCDFRIEKDLDLQQGCLYSLDTLVFKPTGNVSPSVSLQGHGTEANPFKIENVSDLLCFKIAVNKHLQIYSAENNEPADAYTAWVELTQDIDLSSCCGPNIGSWTPIDEFCGHFDGRGHKISGLYINDETSNGGLFRSLYINSYAGNLEIEGYVSSMESALLASESYTIIENIITRGHVISSKGGASGVCKGFSSGILRNCVNYADVESNICSGITNMVSSGATVTNCRNYGKITQSYYDISIVPRAAGIVCCASENTKIINCQNYGEVTGTYYAGGISADSYHTLIANCVNYGRIACSLNEAEIIQNVYVAGISGALRDVFPGKSIGRIFNCLNISDVVAPGDSYAISADGRTQEVSNCWWLYENNNGCVEGVNGSFSNCRYLNSGQLKGIESCGVIYRNYTDIIDALNFAAYTSSDKETEYHGWIYDPIKGWPTISEFPAMPPDDIGDGYLVATEESFSLDVQEQIICFHVKSSSEVSIFLPSWVELISQEVMSNSSEIAYSLQVSRNDYGYDRNDNILLTNTDGCSFTISIRQRTQDYSVDFSRHGNVVTVQNASEGYGIDIIFMGDGYLDIDIESGKYERDIMKGINAFFDVEPYSSYRNLFNVYYIELVSPYRIGNAYLQSDLNSYFGEGTLTGGDNSKVADYCESILGRTDLTEVTAIVIQNVFRYAGTAYLYRSSKKEHASGFSVCYLPLGVSSTGMTSMESTLRHEAGGHSFGKLRDEYSYYENGTIPLDEIENIKYDQEYGWWSNVDFVADPFKVKWSSYIQNDDYESERIGVYEGASTYWSGAYRPTENSIMRHNVGKFNAPSRQAIYTRIHKLAYGDSWEYDHEKFLEYDKVNINKNNTKSNDGLYDVGNEPIPLHAPVIDSRERP